MKGTAAQKEAEKPGNTKLPCIDTAQTLGKDIGNKAVNGSWRERHKRMELTRVGGQYEQALC